MECTRGLGAQQPAGRGLQGSSRPGRSTSGSDTVRLARGGWPGRDRREHERRRGARRSPDRPRACPRARRRVDADAASWAADLRDDDERRGSQAVARRPRIRSAAGASLAERPLRHRRGHRPTRRAARCHRVCERRKLPAGRGHLHPRYTETEGSRTCRAIRSSRTSSDRAWRGRGTDGSSSRSVAANDNARRLSSGRPRGVAAKDRTPAICRERHLRADHVALVG